MRQTHGGQLTARFMRLALAVTALSMWVYIPYRYAVRPPRFDSLLGSTYALLFPLAALLALWVLYVALRPERLTGPTTGSMWFRGMLGAYGALWVTMGLLCGPTLSALATISPVKGLLSAFHMTAQHVFLGLGAVAAAWRPHVARRVLEPEALTRRESAAPGF